MHLECQSAACFIAVQRCQNAALNLVMHLPQHCFEQLQCECQHNTRQRCWRCCCSYLPDSQSPYAGTCDAVVLSLALMGPDYPAYLQEAHRVLRMRGWLWIAEVRSRFVPQGGSAEHFEPFLGCLQAVGLKVVKQDLSNKMFVVWVLRKVQGDELRRELQWPHLRACQYKKR